MNLLGIQARMLVFVLLHWLTTGGSTLSSAQFDDTILYRMIWPGTDVVVSSYVHNNIL